jgi:tetratricopeptide (TPR) repeat protein
MEPETLHIFDAYTRGQLSETEQKNFENRLQSDAELKKEFEEYIHIVNGINEYEQERIKTLIKDRKVYQMYNNRSWFSVKRVASIAAVVLILIIPGYIILRTTTLPSRLINEFYIEDPGLPVTMGASSHPLLEQAMLDYKDKQFEKSLLKINEMLMENPKNDTLNYYAGICYFELGQTDKAISCYEKLNQAESVYYFQAKYNLGLSYIQKRDYKNAITVLKEVVNGDTGPLKDKALELLNKI